MMSNFNFSLSSDVTAVFPKARVLGIYITDLEPKEDTAELEARLIQNFQEDLNRLNEKVLSHKQVTKWSEAFVKLGLNTKEMLPSHIALLKRVLKTKQLMRINMLVDLYNIVSIKNTIPIGGHDLAEIQSVEIMKTKGGEHFSQINSTETEMIASGEIAYMEGDSNEVLTRHLVWRQSNKSRITDRTRTMLVPIDDLMGINSSEQLEDIAEEFLALLSNFYQFNYEIAIISKHSPLHSYSSGKRIDTSSFHKYLLINQSPLTSEQLITQFFDHKLEMIYPSEELLRANLLSGRRLTFYFGADATAPKLHIGHTVPFLKMRQLQDLGHRIIFLVGDFTARIGDPTDKSAARIMLTEEQVKHNAAKYVEQLSKYLDFNSKSNPAQVVFNSQWNSQLNFGDIIDLAANFTVQQMLERDMFAKRIVEEKPIYLHEFLYPLMQGFDSVYLKVDGEFGGSDQTFNMLAGRTLVKNLLGSEKFVLTTKLLLAADGVNKMSKSIGNCIWLEDSPEDKYGKIMAIPDKLIVHYFEMATEFTRAEIDTIQQKLNNEEDPMRIKKQLAYEVTRIHDGVEAAERAQSFFERTIQGKEAPDTTPTFARMELTAEFGSAISLKNLLVATKHVSSGAEAKRLCKSGAVEINGERAEQAEKEYNIADINLIKVGKLRWLKLN